ncbi:phosphatase PAP2 family protein [Vallitalea maricola]|uniref:Phosphatase PAP2 family protein n=1 Tax=Vallitalea maricola TaxID=3074433 RepID=A0ACB5UJ14_9FIRM|nr:phosphatase PAP2 family protein [Vallitalea sp. AN17-2]
MTIFSTINRIDQNIILYISEHLRTPVLDSIMVFFSRIGNAGLVWIVICILLLASKKYRTVGIIAATVLITNTILGELILKNAIGRIRPYDALGLDIIIDKLNSFSMPSGHAISSFSVAFIVAFLVKKWKVYLPILILAIVITLSRVYLSVHYPTDVLLSIIIAFIVSFTATKIARAKGLITDKS